MANFVYDNIMLSGPKADKRATPAGDESRYLSAANWNEARQALIDLQGVLRGAKWGGLEAQAADPAPAGVTRYVWLKNDGTLWLTFDGVATKITGATLDLGPLAVDPFGVGLRMPGGYVHNYADTSIATKTILIGKGSDNEGTRLTGIDATGVAEGQVRILLNWGAIGLLDAGTITLVDENDANAAGSSAPNRIMCPGMQNVTIGPGGVVALIRVHNEAGAARWMVLGQNERFSKAITQSLGFYGSLQIGDPGALLSGTENNWDPVGISPWAPSEGIAGSNLKFRDHTFCRCYVNASGLTITGIATHDIAPSDFGPLKILLNYGPGAITLKHLDAGSLVENRLNCPYSRDLVIPQYGAVFLIHPYYAQPASGTPQWHVLGMANDYFPSVTTPTRITTPELQLTPALSPAALAAGQTNDWNPGARGTVVHVATNASGSTLSGMVPPSASVLSDVGLLRCLYNDGNGVLVLLNENTSSTADNRFYLAAPAIAIPSRSAMWFLYDDVIHKWRPVGRDAVMPALRMFPAITPHLTDGVLPNADTHNYAPTGWNYIQTWRLVPGGASSALTGIGNGTQVDGQLVTIISYDNTLTIKHNDAGSNAANRFYLPGLANITLANMCSATFRYDANNSLWNCIAKAL